MEFDVIVIGSGLSGVLAALHAASLGKRVGVIRKGWGMTALSSGAFEVAGAWHPTDDIGQSVTLLKSQKPFHPYHHLDFKDLPKSMELFKKWFPLRIQGSYSENQHFLSQTGAIIRAAFALESQFLDLKTLGRKKTLALGFKSTIDAPVISHETIASQSIASYLSDTNILPQTLAKRLERPEEIKKLAQHIKSKVQLSSYSLLLMPPILGIDLTSDVKREFEYQVGVPTYEMLGGLNSVPGIRLQKALDSTLRKAGISLIEGHVISFESNARRILSVGLISKEKFLAKYFILATGKYVSGGIVRNQNFKESVFDLPLFYENERVTSWPTQKLLKEKFYKSQPVFQVGIKTNEQLTPLNEWNEPLYENVRVCGTLLRGFDPFMDGTRFGVQMVSGFKAAEVS